MPSLHSVSMMWPFMLWGLALVPVVVGSYIALRGRNHWPAFFMLLGLIVLLLAMTRPRAILLLPSRLETVMLAIDSSGSMRANDVQPSRIELAQAAAKAIVQERPPTNAKTLNAPSITYRFNAALPLALASSLR